MRRKLRRKWKSSREKDEDEETGLKFADCRDGSAKSAMTEKRLWQEYACPASLFNRNFLLKKGTTPKMHTRAKMKVVEVTALGARICRGTFF